MHHLSIDIETYSPEPIAKTGLYKYAQHPDFKILLFGYSLDGGPPIVIDMTQPGAALDYQLVQMLLDPNVQKHAYMMGTAESARITTNLCPVSET